MEILFRADGGEGIGLGHIMRTLVLAKELLKHHKIKYICNNADKYSKGIEKIKSEGIEVISIDCKDELKQIKDISGQFIVVDKYGIDKGYLSSLKEKFNVIYFDDNNELDFYPVDMIINQNIYAKQLKYNTLKETKLLLGKNYTMLREEFRNNNPISINKEVKDVLITLGGSDDFNITENILKQLKNFNFNLHIVIGPAFKYKDSLKKYQQKNIRLYENVNISNLMKKADLVISSCGSTLYELSFLGIPTIGVIVADNQKASGEYMNKTKSIILSDIYTIGEKVNKITYEKRLELSDNMKSIIDGQGVYRVKKEIEKYDI
ncbi:UDP-2,4-diacetamido-2,4,6-trideoxy-beta-L-altropyranose hydrolase [Hathewaya limosa]|uniref:UDP-2,4-diacetamido-2,4, 6-trideoxy-beta-L-altropyranose hydrolase n=1 Tax=Hathewaya limosa TaxID=1536 RepID=A0ABU0JSV4_HATLI|nr:UDP-2,4-diacetamido-2,4,6-trideoxy-beta-L-altropyranose hydrolase [Hathewaya limosa]MDQ0479243.1 UDP-2,4-diacetamido-2,4,6-trideoxy-beta-L-altropyranose hydrolase [Hathewaya limosa]